MHQLRDLRHQFDDQVIISLSGCHPSVLVFGISLPFQYCCGSGSALMWHSQYGFGSRSMKICLSKRFLCFLPYYLLSALCDLKV
jgi:hypothetical protein